MLSFIQPLNSYFHQTTLLKHLYSYIKMKTFWRLLPLCSAIASRVEAANPMKDLVPRLSTGAWITTDLSSAPRWSDYAAPKPGYIVHVAEELDVAATVSICFFTTSPSFTNKGLGQVLQRE